MIVYEGAVNTDAIAKGFHPRASRRWCFARVQKAMMRPHPAPAVRRRLQPHNKT
jgi:hypothetical protein